MVGLSIQCARTVIVCFSTTPTETPSTSEETQTWISLLCFKETLLRISSRTATIFADNLYDICAWLRTFRMSAHLPLLFSCIPNPFPFMLSCISNSFSFLLSSIPNSLPFLFSCLANPLSFLLPCISQSFPLPFYCFPRRIVLLLSRLASCDSFQLLCSFHRKHAFIKKPNIFTYSFSFNFCVTLVPNLQHNLRARPYWMRPYLWQYSQSRMSNEIEIALIDSLHEPCITYITFYERLCCLTFVKLVRFEHWYCANLPARFDTCWMVNYISRHVGLQ